MSKKQICDYKIISRPDTIHLEIDVMDLIGLGYEPIGGVSAFYRDDTETGYVVQAMVKYERLEPCVRQSGIF